MENLLDVKGYATADLFVPHPTRSGLWKMYALPSLRLIFIVTLVI